MYPQQNLTCKPAKDIKTDDVDTDNAYMADLKHF